MNEPSPTSTPATTTTAAPAGSWLARWTGRASAPTARAEYVTQRQVIHTRTVGSMPSAIDARLGRSAPTGR